MAYDATAIIAIPEALLEMAATRHFTERSISRAGRRPRHSTPLPRPSPGRWRLTNTGDAILIQGIGRKADATTERAWLPEDVTYGLRVRSRGTSSSAARRKRRRREDMEGDEFDFLPDNRKIGSGAAHRRPC